MPDPATLHRCPVCWTPFTATNPHARYCCGACRVEDWRRRRDPSTPTPPITESPSRDDNETTTTPITRCPVCRSAFTPVRRQLYCSSTCRNTAWRRRATAANPPPLPVPAPGHRRQTTVYACTDCDTRYLGEQWCPDCAKPCIKVGVGGLCPACDEPVALTDLINPDTPKEMTHMLTP